MPNGVKIFCFLILLPALVALGHDMYLGYTDAEIKKISDIDDVQKGLKEAETHFTFSEFGWLWTKYSIGSHNWAKDALGPENWKDLVPVLRAPAVLVFLTPALLSYAVLLFLWLIKAWPFAATSTTTNFGKGGQQKKTKEEGHFAFEQEIKRKKKGGMTYKRK